MIDSVLTIPDPNAGMRLLFLGAIAFLLALMARIARRSLAEEGLLPRLCIWTEHVGRATGVILVLLGVAPLLPPPLSTALPLVLIGAGAAIGWALREIAEDWIAGVVVLLERKVKVGDWVEVGRHSGTITKMGVRAATLERRDHTIATIPNRALLSNLRVSPPNHVPFELLIRLPGLPDEKPQAIERLKALAAASPWVSPHSAPVVAPDPLRPGLYSIRVKLLEPDMADRFSTALIATTAQLSQKMEE